MAFRGPRPPTPKFQWRKIDLCGYHWPNYFCRLIPRAKTPPPLTPPLLKQMHYAKNFKFGTHVPTHMKSQKIYFLVPGPHKFC